MTKMSQKTLPTIPCFSVDSLTDDDDMDCVVAFFSGVELPTNNNNNNNINNRINNNTSDINDFQRQEALEDPEML